MPQRSWPPHHHALSSPFCSFLRSIFLAPWPPFPLQDTTRAAAMKNLRAYFEKNAHVNGASWTSLQLLHRFGILAAVAPLPFFFTETSLSPSAPNNFISSRRPRLHHIFCCPFSPCWPAVFHALQNERRVLQQRRLSDAERRGVAPPLSTATLPAAQHPVCRFQAAATSRSFTPRLPRATATALLQVCSPTMPRLILRALAVFMLPDAHSWRGLLPPLSCLPCTAAVDAFQRAALCGTLRVLGHHCRKRTCSKRPQEPLALFQAASMLPPSCCCAHTHIATFHP